MTAPHCAATETPATATRFPWMDCFTICARDGRALSWLRRDAVTGSWFGDTELSRCATALSAAHEQPNTFSAAAWAAQTLLPVPGELVIINRLTREAPRRRAEVYSCGHEHRTWHPTISGFLTPMVSDVPKQKPAPAPRRCCGKYAVCPRGLDV